MADTTNGATKTPMVIEGYQVYSSDGKSQLQDENELIFNPCAQPGIQ